MNNENTIEQYTKEDMLAALPPVVSIISKSEKAQLKFAQGELEPVNNFVYSKFPLGNNE